MRIYMKTFNEFDALKEKVIAKHFPVKDFIDDSVVGEVVNKAFNLAWEDCHSDGEVSVSQKFDDLMDLIKPLID